MCGDRSVAWEWSNSHVYWAFNRCAFYRCCSCCFFIVHSLAHWIFFLLNIRWQRLRMVLQMLDGFSRWCRCHWQHLAVFVLTLYVFLHWSICAVVAIAIHRVYVLLLLFVLCAGHFPIFSRWIVNCYCIWESRKCAFMVKLIHMAQLVHDRSQRQLTYLGPAHTKYSLIFMPFTKFKVKPFENG